MDKQKKKYGCFFFNKKLLNSIVPKLKKDMLIDFVVDFTQFEFMFLLAVKVITSDANLKMGDYGGITIKA